jgi:hypothetical protein
MLIHSEIITVLAHIQPGELLRLIESNVAAYYFVQGYKHILPYGYDHIAFIIGLFLLSPRLKPILWQATAFTIAHSITLGLAMYNIITPSLHIIEPLIALSIIYVAIENIVSSKLRPARIGIVFLFGLVHGLGFAGGLAHLGLSREHFFSCLILFNVGVEVGQITVILVCYFLIAKWFAGKPYYRKRIVIPLSAIIGLLACFWLIQRTLMLN